MGMVCDETWPAHGDPRVAEHSAKRVRWQDNIDVQEIEKEFSMKPAAHVRTNLTDDGLVVLDIEKGRIFTANPIAAHIWQNLVVGNKPKPEVVDAIVEEWGSTPDVVAKDLEEFVVQLKLQQLIVDVAPNV
jgi:hypothetical protein